MTLYIILGLAILVFGWLALPRRVGAYLLIYLIATIGIFLTMLASITLVPIASAFLAMLLGLKNWYVNQRNLHKRVLQKLERL